MTRKSLVTRSIVAIYLYLNRLASNLPILYSIKLILCESQTNIVSVSTKQTTLKTLVKIRIFFIYYHPPTSNFDAIELKLKEIFCYLGSDPHSLKLRNI